MRAFGSVPAMGSSKMAKNNRRNSLWDSVDLLVGRIWMGSAGIQGGMPINFLLDLISSIPNTSRIEIGGTLLCADMY